jgi:hypothetical protein
MSSSVAAYTYPIQPTHSSCRPPGGNSCRTSNKQSEGNCMGADRVFSKQSFGPITNITFKSTPDTSIHSEQLEQVHPNRFEGFEAGFGRDGSSCCREAGTDWRVSWMFIFRIRIFAVDGRWYLGPRFERRDFECGQVRGEAMEGGVVGRGYGNTSRQEGNVT